MLCLPKKKRRIQEVQPHVRRVKEEINAKLLRCFDRLAGGGGRWPLFLHGLQGTGKTCASLYFLDWVPDSMYVLFLWLADEAFERSTHLWRQAEHASLLVVDEVAERKRNGATEYEYRAIKRVADMRADKPTIYISNATPKAIAERYGGPIHSRICSGTCFPLTGKDKRFGH